MASTRAESLTVNDTDKVSGLRILIAEDEADCAESLAWLLRFYGHKVEIARNGLSALEAAQAHQPDVLLLDLGLPGISGYEVAERLKKQAGEKKPFIIAVTGFGREQDRRQSEASGIDLHLTKPVDPEQLRAVLSRFHQIVGTGEAD